MNWDRYVASDAETFECAAREFVAITTADVRGQIIRRLPQRRHRRFEHCLNRYLYSEALLSQLEGGERPTLVLNATDLRHGTAAAFIGGSFVPDVRKPKRDDGTPTNIDVGPFSLASAVACSAAFPALFPERALSAKDFAQPRKKWEAGAALVDGGVYDNLGIQYFLGLQGKLLPAAFYVSDAGAPFDYAAGLSGNVFSRTARVTAVQMDLLRVAVIEDAEHTSAPIRHISITDEPANRQELRRPDLLAGVPRPELVRRLQLIRTDLDEFSGLEIDLLIRHGYTVAYKALTGGLARTASVTAVWSVAKTGRPPDAATIQQQSAELERSQRRRWRLLNPRDGAFPAPWFMIAVAICLLWATVEVVRPFIRDAIRSPLVDELITGQPYRLTQVMRYVVLQPGAEREGRRGVLATSRLFYWARLNRAVTPEDSTFREAFTPTYEREPSVHGLGVIGANAIRESKGTFPFEIRQELTFEGAPGETLLLGTGVQYEFDWPGTPRSLHDVHFEMDEDYWAYDNTADYIDRLVIVVESRSDQLLIAQAPDCAIVYRANRTIERSGCRLGENHNEVRPGLSLFGGALLAEFKALRPGDDAIIKYRLAWR
jgi:predicted acylesterase/phospholipase RssA